MKSAETEVNQKETLQSSTVSVVKGIPLRFKDAGFNNFIAKNKLLEIKNRCFELIKTNKSLVLCGKVGNGKTHLAIAMLRNLPPKLGKYAHEPLVSARGEFLIADEFFAKLNHLVNEGKDKSEVIAKILNQNELVVLDEIRIKNFSESKRENLYLFINRAYLDMRRIVITTNFTPAQLEQLDEPSFSRLTEFAEFINFDFEDYRINLNN